MVALQPANDVSKARAAVSSTVRWGTPRQPGPAIITELPGHARRAFPGSGSIGMDSPAPPPNQAAAKPGTDGFCQGRLRVYINHAPSTEAVALRPQTGLTGPGSHRYSYAGLVEATSIPTRITDAIRP